MTLNQGLMLERLIGVQAGHPELQGAIEAWLTTLNKKGS